MAGDDIVARLRLYAQKQRETKSSVLGLLLSDAADEIERLRAERDEARRLWCIDIGELYSSSPLSLAKERGWDCFKEGNPK